MWDFLRIILSNIMEQFFKMLPLIINEENKKEKIDELKTLQKNFNKELNKQIKILSAEIDEKFDELRDEIEDK
ncbi:hypothetical protein SAMN02745164_02047 [Marinitoga hydrogenitolerans DSM 16785]|uniref:Uncharacterized protein n=1 Tax=Marinitoga hydrogenitolerans (strain DSM 16785 / JCM 12826 / AT1271) TaxID=1122195 RepID=A0A1M4ZYT2_MARH1|nr:hypothetical protein [Marinitoga hydrogenitolerans]SHF22806.1 hypothetical protein SAMN02745164_02047 [Marinitoga hydrogenitolerans DSM 16785]